MKWRGGRAGGRVEDRRGMGGAVAGGGIGLALLGLIGYYFFGIDPQTTQQVATQFGAGQQQEGQVGTPEDEAGRFVDVIGSNVNDVWSRTLDGYQPPNVVIYDQGTGTGCGYGQSAMGPFYCPLDQTIYLDLDFWQEMETQLGASGAEFARAYVIAHEFGHHVQTLTGASQAVRDAQQRAANQEEANQYSIALELGGLLCRRLGRQRRNRSNGAVARSWRSRRGPSDRTRDRRRRPAAAIDRPRHTGSLHPRHVRPAHGMAEPRLPDRRSERLRHLQLTGASSRKESSAPATGPRGSGPQVC